MPHETFKPYGDMWKLREKLRWWWNYKGLGRVMSIETFLSENEYEIQHIIDERCNYYMKRCKEAEDERDFYKERWLKQENERLDEVDKRDKILSDL